MLLKPSSHLSSLDSHHRVIASCVTGCTLKEFGTDRSFFQLFGVSVEFVANDVLEELPAANCVLEEAAVKNAVEFLKHDPGLTGIFFARIRGFGRVARMLNGKAHGWLFAPGTAGGR